MFESDQGKEPCLLRHDEERLLMLKFMEYDMVKPYNTHSCISEMVQLLCHKWMHTSQSLRQSLKGCYSWPQAPGVLEECILALVALGGRA